MGQRIQDWSGELFYEAEIPDPAQGGNVPAGRFYTGFGSLRIILARSARWHARQAVKDFVGEDDNEQLHAAACAGTAVELLAMTGGCAGGLLTLAEVGTA